MKHDFQNNKEYLNFPISGMHCVSCANRLQKNIALEFKIDAQVSFATEELKLPKSQFELTKENWDKLCVLIVSSGFQIPFEKLTGRVEGMHCVGCSNRLEKGINELVGVKALISFANEAIELEFYPSVVGLDEIKLKAKELGFQFDFDENYKQEGKTSLSIKLNLILAVILAFPFFITMIPMLWGNHQTFVWFPLWLQFLLATIIQFKVGWPFLIGAFRSIKSKSANMDVLVAGGTLTAWTYSSILWLLDSSAMHNYFDAVAMIITLVLVGKYLEIQAKEKAGMALSSLISMQPKIARIRNTVNNDWTEVPISQVKLNDEVLVRHGDQIPIDGDVIEGLGAVDESLLTGEFSPKSKKVGDQVLAGTLQVEGSLVIRATTLGNKTQLAEMLRMIKSAQSSRAPIQYLADLVASYFVPSILIISVLTFLFYFLITASIDLSIMRSVAVLVIACPCALGLATPTAIIVGVGCGAKAGLLFRNAKALESANKIDTILIDKTGTLTKNQPVLKVIIPFHGVSEKEVLRIAASIESGSSHPLATAIVNYAKQNDVSLFSGIYEVIPGQGVLLKNDNDIYYAGTFSWVKKIAGILNLKELEGIQAQITKLCCQGMSVVSLAKGNSLIGIIGIFDEVRPSAVSLIKLLKNKNIDIHLVTGDNELTASAVAKIVGIEHIHSEILPADKGKLVTDLKAQGKKIGMVGDGVNDAAALALADISFAMGKGSNIAQDSADIILMKDNLIGISDAIELSTKTLRKIKQNLFFAFFYNILGIPLAILGILPPIFAAMAMALSSLTVVTNALTLKSWKKSKTTI